MKGTQVYKSLSLAPKDAGSQDRSYLRRVWEPIQFARVLLIL
jgi:hypothetical protein